MQNSQERELVQIFVLVQSFQGLEEDPLLGWKYFRQQGSLRDL